MSHHLPRPLQRDTLFKLKTWAAALALATMAGAAPAALVLQGGGAEVLDTDTDLLWLRDWRMEGLKTWSESGDWASALTVGGAAAGEWRLPTIAELEDLWADPDVGGSSVGLKANFDNVQATSLYWTGTSVDSSIAVAFSPHTGNGLDFNKGRDLYAVAVRSAASGGGGTAVPEPQSAALALLGLGLVAAQSRLRQRDAARGGASSPLPAALA